MQQLTIDPKQFEKPDQEDAGGPIIAMIVSLGFPGMNAAAASIQTATTALAFDAVRIAGGRPRLVTYTTGEQLQQVAEVCDWADALVFLGGSDVDPSCYGYEGELPGNLYGIDGRGDEYCLRLLREAAHRDLPTLAICKGSQLMNVAFGGTLYPDLPEWQLHKGDGDPLFINEEVLFESDSELARIYGADRLTVRNGHHQAVADVAPDLEVMARAHDGIVEATRHRNATWMIGVQWHPEEPGGNVADRDRIFAALVEQAC
ncbi:gamma-glutamyl-gamma-aminobutyrate hydrolase family protein [Leucobacter sp. 1207-22]|uniref:gamma-glutamyl-gamma-aminobutyrate hydrolase family protein n=1 Tax=Leucobacter sp. 1207-22 TaxID=2604456 RepID=UPI004064250F